MPTFTWAATISLALPLFVVTMASQNLPGVSAIRAAGYTMPISKIITLTGVATLILAPFGAFALNLSAITAAICMGKEAHPRHSPIRLGFVALVDCAPLVMAQAAPGLIDFLQFRAHRHQPGDASTSGTPALATA